VMNLCLAVGPESSRIVRYYYLLHNSKFLAHTILGFARKNISRDKAGRNHIAWMTVNTHWKTIAVRDDWMDELKLACKERGSGKKPRNIPHPVIAFNNPAVAIQLGLFSSVQHLVEVKGIDINSFEWTPLCLSKRYHLLYIAVRNSKKKTFKYLLNRPGFNIRCRVNESNTGHPLFLSLLSAKNQAERFEPAFLRMFMQHPDFHINRQIIPCPSTPSRLVTPLYSVTVQCARVLEDYLFDEQEFQAVHQATQILLSAGADPNLSFPDSLSPISYLRRRKSDAQSENYIGLGDFDATERYWDESIALLEKYVSKTVVAPPGKLGIFLASKTYSKGAVVFEVSTSSVLADKVSPEDRIIAIDGEDVSGMTVSEIATILDRKSEFERILTVLTTKAQADDQPSAGNYR